jgi:hypothetical protein
MVQGQPRQKSKVRPYLNKQTGHGGTYLYSNLLRKQMIEVLGQNTIPYLKNNLKQKGLKVWLPDFKSQYQPKGRERREKILN